MDGRWLGYDDAGETLGGFISSARMNHSCGGRYASWSCTVAPCSARLLRPRGKKGRKIYRMSVAGWWSPRSTIGARVGMCWLVSGPGGQRDKGSMARERAVARGMAGLVGPTCRRDHDGFSGRSHGFGPSWRTGRAIFRPMRRTVLFFFYLL
jgi:hypothetical protein